MSRASEVTIVEVGPRDGLQNEAAAVSTADKIAFVDRLGAAGLPVIEVSAFVSPRWVPQMADASEVFAGITRRPGVRYTALVPNLGGLERAQAAGVTEVAIFAAASETFSRKNINQTIDASLETYRAVMRDAQSSASACAATFRPLSAARSRDPSIRARVADVAAQLIGMGAFEVAVSDTIGIAHPGRFRVVVEAVAARVPRRADRAALSRHARHGARQRAHRADLGIATFDASAGGLGGCPYAPGATGNLATEDLIYMLDGLDIRTGVNLDALVEAARFMEPRVGHALPSRYNQAARSRR